MLQCLSYGDTFLWFIHSTKLDLCGYNAIAFTGHQNVDLVQMNAKNAAAESVAKVSLSQPFPLT